MKTTIANFYTTTILFLFLTVGFATKTSAQQLEVKGVVYGKSDSKTEVLNGANIYLKGTNLGTSTNRKGEFTFPKKLTVGDVLIVSYLGYLKKEVKLNPTDTNLNIFLEEDPNEMLGALSSNKPYKSKRKN